MSVLAAIILVSLVGGVLSISVAAVFAYSARVERVPMLVSYAVGALLGAVFLEILPHALEHSKSVQHITMTILFGILLFFILEKLVLWRHCHHSGNCEAHHDYGRTGMMILVGDTFHNFVDGIIIAAAFLSDFQLGVVTAVAIIAHEIPQEVGDFVILLHSGYSKGKAYFYNLLSAMAMLVGGVLAYYALQSVQDMVPYFLGLAAASMLYVSVADLIPGLHKRAELRATAQQVLLIGMGIASIWLTGFVLGEVA